MGFQFKKPSVGGVWIFSGTTKSTLILFVTTEMRNTSKKSTRQSTDFMVYVVCGKVSKVFALQQVIFVSHLT